MNIKDIFAQNGLVIQEQPYTCGPCSLLNVLHLKGDTSHTEIQLADLCGARPGVGVSHEALVKAAKALGLVLVEEKRDATVAELEKHIDAGAILIINFTDMYSGNGHYAVVAEHDDRAFYLRDCTAGFFRFEKQFFEKFWRSGDGIPRWYMAIK